MSTMTAEKAVSLPSLTLHERELSDVEMLGIGAFHPLRGFMAQADYVAVRDSMHLASGQPWSMPITLSISAAQKGQIKEGSEVALKDAAGKIKAILKVEEIYASDKKTEAEKVYRTTEEKHPGVAALYAQGEFLIGGPIQVLELPDHDDFLPYRLTPAQTREAFAKLGWKSVVGFQTRNPIHRAHEYLLKCAMEITDGLLLHPLVGATKSDDIPASVRMKCYEVLLENYFPKNRVLLSVNPAAMRYAGPREAIFHALVRRNFGCTHFIVGRDHAGVGSYYGTYDAQKIFSEFKPGDLGITPLFFENSFWCKRTQSMATEKTSPSAPEERISLSGTKVRELLVSGQIPPVEFSRPEVAKILIDAMKPK